MLPHEQSPGVMLRRLQVGDLLVRLCLPVNLDEIPFWRLDAALQFVAKHAPGLGLVVPKAVPMASLKAACSPGQM